MCLSPSLFHLICLFLARQQEVLFKETDAAHRSSGLLELECSRAAPPYFGGQSLTETLEPTDSTGLAA